MAKSNAKYWKDRMDEIMAYVDKTDIDFFNELQKIYQDYYQQTTKELFGFYQKYAEDNKITLQEAKKRLMREDLSDYRANAEKYFKQAEKDSELLKRLNEQYTAAKATRKEALNLNIEWMLGTMNGTINKAFEGYLKDTAKHVWKKVTFGNSPSTLSPHTLEEIVTRPWKGSNYSKQLWGNTDDLAKDLKDVFTKGFIKGSSPADMAREIRKKYNVARSRAETLIQTDGTNIVNNATIKRYQEAGLTKYQFWAHLDSRTTKECKEHHKKVYPIEEYEPGENAPPLHYRCRSTVLPDDEEIGMEADFHETTKKRNAEYVKKKEGG